MPSSVRIARMAGTGYQPAGDAGSDPLTEHGAIVALIRRHLPSVTGSMFASPNRVGEAGEIEWYSDLAGQPTPLQSLPQEGQAQVKALLIDRVASVRELADQLPQIDPGSAHLADALRRAVSYPGEETVYVIGGQPVLTFWGHHDPARPPPAPVAPVPAPAAAATAAGLATAAGGRRFPWGWLATALLLLALASLFYWWFYLREPEVPAVIEPPPDYPAILAAALGDCERMKELAERLANPDVVATADLPKVRETLRVELEKCRPPDYRQMLNDALGDCGRISELAVFLAKPDLIPAPELPTVRDVVARELKACQRPDYRQMLNEAMGDCKALEALHIRLKEPEDPDHPELAAVRKELDAALGECRMAGLRRDFEVARKDCKSLKSFGSRLRAADAGLAGYGELKSEMIPLLEECNTPKVDPMQLCPGERPKELAPDLVLVFDASGSMNMPLLSDEEIQRRGQQARGVGGPLGELAMMMQFGNMTKRVDVAKKATRNLVSGLPGDVDVGLVLVRDCPQAQKVGFYSPSQRSKLARDINAISPHRKTPLASGIKVAGGMIDGVETPALMVVISDGKETCGANPCAVAQQLAAAKPRLKINVVDILGTGAGNCVAAATKGRVFTANNADQLSQMLGQAVSEVQGPAHCRK